MNEKQKNPEVGEDATQYGEFISSYFSWIPLPVQKENAEKMVQMTKNDKREQKKNSDKHNKEGKE